MSGSSLCAGTRKSNRGKLAGSERPRRRPSDRIRLSKSETAGISSAAATRAITMVMTAISGCRGRRVGAGADRTLADDDLIPALGLIEHIRPVRRTGVASDVAALIVDRQTHDAELPVDVFVLHP